MDDMEPSKQAFFCFKIVFYFVHKSPIPTVISRISPFFLCWL
jgi:hypothetical protein